jgi:hypothetical protein
MKQLQRHWHLVVMPAHNPNNTKAKAKVKGISKPAKHKKLDIACKSKKEVGDAGEKFVCEHLPCQTCGIRKWYNLNKENPNFAGVDLKCLHCGDYVQVKTGKHQLIPHRTGWKIPTSPATVRDTLRKYKGKLRYIAVLYDNKGRVTEVCVTEPLTSKNLFHTENCFVSYDLHNWTPAMLQSM